MSRNFSKKGGVFLWGLVIVIWGIVGIYCVHSFSGFRSNKKADSASIHLMDSLKIDAPKYKVQLNRDPFLKATAFTKKSKTNRTYTKKKNATWPKIVYVGVLHEKHQSLYLFKINNRLNAWKKGEEKFGVQLHVTQKGFVFTQNNERKLLEFKTNE